MPAEAAIHIVEDPEDSLGLAQLVAGLANRLQGRAVCRPTPGAGTSAQLAADLLVALGKRFDASRFERVLTRAWDLVNIWIEAEQVRHLFVLRAHLQPARAWGELVSLGRRAGVEIWMVCAADRASRDRPVEKPQVWSPAAFAAHWLRDKDNGDGDGADDGFPEVPTEDFPTFRASCRRLLDSPAFERVDRVYRASMDETTAWLACRQPRSRRMVPPEINVADAATQLQGLLVGDCGPAEAVVRLRGAQAVYFRDGWLISFEPTVVPSDSGLVTLGQGLDAVVAARLRRLCTPRSAAAMVLFLVADLRSEALCRLDIGDVAADASSVDVDEWHINVPVYARSLLRALAVERRGAGASEDDPLFVHPRTGGRYVGSALRNVLRSVGAKTGISVGVHDSLGSPSGPGAWLGARGMEIIRLDPVPTATR